MNSGRPRHLIWVDQLTKWNWWNRKLEPCSCWKSRIYQFGSASSRIWFWNRVGLVSQYWRQKRPCFLLKNPFFINSGRPRHVIRVDQLTKRNCKMKLKNERLVFAENPDFKNSGRPRHVIRVGQLTHWLKDENLIFAWNPDFMNSGRPCPTVPKMIIKTSFLLNNPVFKNSGRHRHVIRVGQLAKWSWKMKSKNENLVFAGKTDFISSGRPRHVYGWKLYSFEFGSA